LLCAVRAAVAGMCYIPTRAGRCWCQLPCLMPGCTTLLCPQISTPPPPLLGTPQVDGPSYLQGTAASYTSIFARHLSTHTPARTHHTHPGSADNTKAALHFANAAKRVTMRPQLNQVADSRTLLRSMAAEIDALKKQLVRGRGGLEEGVELRGHVGMRGRERGGGNVWVAVRHPPWVCALQAGLCVKGRCTLLVCASPAAARKHGSCQLPDLSGPSLPLCHSPRFLSVTACLGLSGVLCVSAAGGGGGPPGPVCCTGC
jgi:hypothetical protein